MHLLAVTTFNDRSEVAVYRGLVAGGDKVSLVCHPSAREREALASAGITVYPLRIRHRLDLLAVWRLRRILFRTYPDVIYAPRNSTLSVSLLAGRGLPAKVIAYRGTIGHVKRYDPASWLTYLHPRLHRINCVSNAVQAYLRSCGIPEEKLVTIHKGHDLRWYESGQPPDLSEFGIPPGAFTAGFIGSVRPVKGVDVLLKAFMLLPAQFPAHLLIIGEVRDPRIRRLLRDPALSHRVHLAGFRRDAALLAKSLDVFVMPSLEREGLPRAVIEAMAQGVPVIVSAVGGLPELVIHEESGLLVPPRDPDALAEAIMRLGRNQDLRMKLGRQGRERIATEFNVMQTLERMRALFHAAASEP